MQKLERLNSLLHRSGFEVTRYNKGTSATLRRKAIIEKYGINLIIDVGANTGVYGRELRQTGYKKEIVSFEPLTDAFGKLVSNIGNDSNWRAFNFALGSEKGRQLINVSANSHSSSILQILDEHTIAEATASYIGKQEIQIDTLDSVFNDINGTGKELFLKIDTQGYELNVLKGGQNSLHHIQTIQLEMSLRSLYAGQPLYKEVMDFLHFHNYTLIDIEPGFADLKAGTLLQFDGIFRRSEAID